MDGGTTAAATGFGAKIGASMMTNPIGWALAGLSVVNYFSARRKQQKMRERMAPIAADQMGQIVGERKEIVGEYRGMAKTAQAQGDVAMSALATNRQQRMDKASQNIGGANLAYGGGNLASDNLLSAFNDQMSQRSMQTTNQTVAIQNRLAGELRSLDSSALQLKSMYAQQGINVGYNMTNVDQLKYV